MKKFILHLIIITVTAVLITPKTILAGLNARVGFDVPTLGEWGLIGTAVVLGVAGLYNILKRK